MGWKVKPSYGRQIRVSSWLDRLGGLKPIWFGLIEVIVFEDQVNAVRRPVIRHGVHRHVIDFRRLSFRELVAHAVYEKRGFLVRLERNVDLMGPFCREIRVAVRVDDATRRKARGGRGCSLGRSCGKAAGSNSL